MLDHHLQFLMIVQAGAIEESVKRGRGGFFAAQVVGEAVAALHKLPPLETILKRGGVVQHAMDYLQMQFWVGAGLPSIPRWLK